MCSTAARLHEQPWAEPNRRIDGEGAAGECTDSLPGLERSSLRIVYALQAVGAG